MQLEDQHKWRLNADYYGGISIEHICGFTTRVTDSWVDWLELADLLAAMDEHITSCRA